jgi:nucleotide-binding universal stress UspA family protein
VTSDLLFATDPETGKPVWQYSGGAVLNSTITLGDGMLFFLESRNPEAISAPFARQNPNVLTDQWLVALDLKTGKKLWQKTHDFSACKFMTYLVYGKNTVVVTGTDASKNFHTFAFNAPSPRGNQDTGDDIISAIGGRVLWSESHKEDKGHHSGHLQHPVVIGDTFPATAIVDAIHAPSDVVVMATHGRSGIGRALLGSVAEDLMKRVDNPVILIGPDATADRSLTGGTLLVTTDGSPRSAMILPTASRFAKALELQVIVVTVGSPGAEDDELLRAAAASVGFFRSEGGVATHQHLVGTDVPGSIVALAEQIPASLLAMTTHGRGGFGRTALGSTTMRVVHSGPCPVIVERSRN